MALIKIIWKAGPREVSGIGIVSPKQEILLRDSLAHQLIRQGFAKLPGKKRHRARKKTKKTNKIREV